MRTSPVTPPQAEARVCPSGPNGRAWIKSGRDARPFGAWQDERIQRTHVTELNSEISNVKTELIPRAQGLVQTVTEHIRDGRIQRSLALVAAGSSFVSGLEVSYEHYKGSYSNPVMYSPVLLSGALT